MIRAACIVSLILTGLPVAGCSTASPQLAALPCAVAADLAPQLKADSIDPIVAGTDCRATLAAAGVPMLPLKKPSDPAGTPGLNHIYQIKSVESVDADTVRVKLDYACNVWCGHGEEVTAKKQSGHWVVADRKTTWIS